MQTAKRGPPKFGKMATRVAQNEEAMPSRADLNGNPLEAVVQPVVTSTPAPQEAVAPPAPVIAPPPLPTETTISEVGVAEAAPEEAAAAPAAAPITRKIIRPRSKSAIASEKETKATTERQRYKDAETEEIQRQRYLLVPESDDPTKRLPTAFHPPTRAGIGEFLYKTFRSFTLEPIRQDLTQDACKKMMAGPGAGNQVEMFLYQKFIREYIRGMTPYRGILVYHGLGSGKTCSAIAGAEALYGAGSVKKIIIMTPGSLRGNFQSQIQFCGFRHYQLDNHWVFQPVFDAGSRMYAKQLLDLPDEFLAEVAARADDDLRGVWYPDFSKSSPEGRHYNTLPANVQAAIRKQIVKTLESRITFINYNGILSTRLKEYACTQPGYFDNAVIIIDEVHNLTRLMAGKLNKYLMPPKTARRPGATSVAAMERAQALKENYEPITTDTWMPKLCGSAKKYERAYMFYRFLSCAKNSKIIALSGTPIINKPDEVGILLNILGGHIHTASGALVGKSEEAKAILRKLVADHPRLDSIFFKPATGDATTVTPFTVSIFKEGYKKVTEAGPDGQAVFKGLVRDEDDDPVYQTDIKTAFAELVSSAQAAGLKLRASVEEKVPGETYKAEPLFPPTRGEFNDMFVDAKTSSIINDNTFMRRAFGLVSYYKGAIEGVMPKARDHIVEVPLKGYALAYYLSRRKKEIEEESPADEGDAEEDDDSKPATSAYRFNSRAASNFAFPATIPRPFRGKMLKFEPGQDEVQAAAKTVALEEGTVALEDVVEEQQELDAVQKEEAAIKQEEKVEVAAAAPVAPVAAAVGEAAAANSNDEYEYTEESNNENLPSDEDENWFNENEEGEENEEGDGLFSDNEEGENEEGENEEGEQEGGMVPTRRIIRRPGTEAAAATTTTAAPPVAPVIAPLSSSILASPTFIPSGKGIVEEEDITALAPAVAVPAPVVAAPVPAVAAPAPVVAAPTRRLILRPGALAPTAPSVAPTEVAAAAPEPVVAPAPTGTAPPTRRIIRRPGDASAAPTAAAPAPITAPVAPVPATVTATVPAKKGIDADSIYEPSKGDISSKRRGDAAKLRAYTEVKGLEAHAADSVKSYEQQLTNAINRLRAERDTLLIRRYPDGSPGPLYDFAPKFAAMIERIDATPGTSLIYSAFKTAEGLGIFGIALEASGYTKIEYTGKDEDLQFTEETVRSFTDPDLKDKPRYMFFTGDGDLATRKAILNIFNANIQSLPPKIKSVIEAAGLTNNIEGQICRVIGITGAGAEGISLKTVRAVHIMEPYWNRVRTEQVKGRAIRICSHMDIVDPAERTVEIYTYISTFDQKDIDSGAVTQTIKVHDGGRTTDQHIYDLAARKDKLNQSFIDTLKNVAVDCLLNIQQNKEEIVLPDGSTEVSYPTCFPGMPGTIDTPAFIPNLFEDKVANEGIRVRGVDSRKATELAQTATKEVAAAPVSEAARLALAAGPTRLQTRRQAERDAASTAAAAVPVAEAAPKAPVEKLKKSKGVVEYISIGYKGASYIVVPDRGSDECNLYDSRDILRTTLKGKLKYSTTLKNPDGSFKVESIRLIGQ